MYFVYILKSNSRGKFYIGSTSDVLKRLEQHNTARSGYTNVGQPWELVYSERFSTKLEAIKREKEIKRMKSARYIESLVNTQSLKTDA